MLLVLLLFCASTWWWSRQWRLERMTAQIPTLPGRLPIIGHAHLLLGDTKRTPRDVKSVSANNNLLPPKSKGRYLNTYENFSKWRAGLWEFMQGLQTDTIRRGGIVKMWIGPCLYFVVTDPKIAQNTLNTFVEKVYIYDFAKSWLGNGLLTADVSTWKRHRKLLIPTFNQRILDGFLDVFNGLSAQLVEDIRKELGKEEFDIKPYLQNISLKNICQTALGLSASATITTCNEEYMDAVHKMNNIMCTRFQNTWLHPSFIYNWTKTNKEEEQVVKILKKMSSNTVITRKAKMTENLSKGTKTCGRSIKGFLDCLLELQSEGLLTDKEISEEVDTIIVAGTDTISKTLMFTLILVASHSDVQDRLYEEIQEVLSESSTNINVTKERLSQFVFMEAVIKEALRIYPIAPAIARNVTKTYKQGNLIFPSGCGIIVLISGIHRNDTWGKDADVFRPERWLDGSLPKDPAAFASFSLGRRGCLGQNYAMMLMKTTLAHFLRHYRVSRIETELRLTLDVLLSAAAGHHISIQLRQ